MKNKLSVLLTIVLITFCSECSGEMGENYFKGSVSEITDSYFAVIPDDTEPIKDIGDVILVPKEVVSTRGVPELSVNDRIQVVYNETEKTDAGIALDIVYAIYREDELKELK